MGGVVGGGRITSGAGGWLPGAANRAIGLVRRLAGCLADRRGRELVEHTFEAMLEQRICGIACDQRSARKSEKVDADARMSIGKVLNKLRDEPLGRGDAGAGLALPPRPLVQILDGSRSPGTAGAFPPTQSYRSSSMVIFFSPTAGRRRSRRRCDERRTRRSFGQPSGPYPFPVGDTAALGIEGQMDHGRNLRKQKTESGCPRPSARAA